MKKIASEKNYRMFKRAISDEARKLRTEIVTAWKEVNAGVGKLQLVLGDFEGDLYKLVEEGKIPRDVWYAAYKQADETLLKETNESGRKNNALIDHLNKL